MGDKDEWTEWDYALIDALQVIEDFTDQKTGIPIWELEDDYVHVDAERRINKFQQSVDNATKGSKKKPYEPRPGEYFVPAMHSRRKVDGEEVFQTYAEWREKKAQESDKR